MTEGKIPEHVALIMDGNGRWAKKRNLPRVMGHRAGIKTVRRVIEASLELGVKYLTLYTFSTENWKRPKKEVNALMSLLREYLIKELKQFNKEEVRLLAIGQLERLPQSVKEALDRAIDKTKDNSRLTLTLALSYGGRNEIVQASKKIAEDIKINKIRPNQINEELFSKYLYTHKIPDPDLLIRTSNELRLSNFLLWQISYTELYFCHKLWPDFTERDFKRIVEDYKKRERRFGNI
ncbi:MAG TPA: isoprenyl transferase [Candidatus Omnitrophica bacterium]|nr:isoprenyl transferase [Candidatus Omnitrophota bacterium]